MSLLSSNTSQYPLVTIGLPVYNGAATLAAALSTLIRQEYPNIEIIISDNASTDETVSICEEFARKDTRIRIIKKQTNEGPVANFQTVLDAAAGEYFMWAADDDYWYPQFISRLLPVLQANEAAGVAMCAVNRQLPDGSPYDHITFSGKYNPNKFGHLKLLSKILSGAKYNLFIYGLFRVALLKKAMHYFPDVLGGDRQFICQMALACRFAYLDEVLLTRTHQPKHAEAYTAAMIKKGIIRKQLSAFVTMILTSSIIPFSRKAFLPLVAIYYLMFALRQKYSVQLSLPRKIARYLHLSLNLVLIVTGVLFASIFTTWLLFYLGQLSNDAFITVVTIILLIASSTIINRAYLIRYKKAVSHCIEKHESSASQLLCELRYFSDALLYSELSTGQARDNKLAEYLACQVEKHKNAVAFARNLEKSKIREVNIQDLFSGIENESVPVGVINELTGHESKTDMMYIAAIAKHSGAKMMFEFGGRMGRTAFYLAHNSPNGQVFILDSLPESEAEDTHFSAALFKGCNEESRITTIHSDFFTFNTIPYSKQFDFVLVNGVSSYEHVRNNTQKAFELLRPGGIILWLDYVPKSDGLVRFIREFTQDCPLFRIRSTSLLVYIDGIDVMYHKLADMPHCHAPEHREKNHYLAESACHS